jgi:hypothetical protein
LLAQPAPIIDAIKMAAQREEGMWQIKPIKLDMAGLQGGLLRSSDSDGSAARWRLLAQCDPEIIHIEPKGSRKISTI